MSRGGAIATRADRRRLKLDQRRDQRRRRSGAAPQPSRLRSPMVVFTVAALLVGALVVGYALLSRPTGPSVDELAEPIATVPFGLSDGRTLGKAEAPVTIDIWSDFQCPACRDLTRRLEPALVDNFVVPGTVRLVYHDAAFQGARAGGAYDESVEAAAGARCAAEQGAFWHMHNWLFANWAGENEGAFAAPRLHAIAEGAELNMTDYDTCMATGDQQAAAQAETASAVAQGINQTPTLFVNEVKLVGVPTMADLSTVIAQAAQ